MEKNIKTYTISCLVFLCLLSLSGNLTGILGGTLYFAAFAVPSILPLLTLNNGIKDTSFLFGKIKEKRLIIAASPLCLFTIFGLSYITSFIINGITGEVNPSLITNSPLYDILTLAVAPALLEELLFRYLPIKLIAPYSKKSAILISSLFFAFVHANLFSIPYAAIAGFIFIIVDLAAGSVWPSVILHFLNNLISIIWEYSLKSGTAHIFLFTFIILTLLSLMMVIFMRKKYLVKIKEHLEKTDKITFPAFTSALLIPTALIALLDLFL